MINKRFKPALRLLISGILTIFSFIAFAQVTVHHVDENLSINDKQGVFYALPRTFIKVDITVIKTEYYAGPYSEFAGKYLDLEDVATNDYNEYAITDVKLSTLAEPDPGQYYFVEFDEKTLKEDEAILFSLSEAGLSSGINGTVSKKDIKESMTARIDAEDAYSGLFQYQAETNLYEKTDTIIRKVVVDTVTVEKMYFEKKWVEKSTEQKAVEAANMISKLRENRFNLITGYHEIAYDAGTMSYMDQELQKMEDEYLSLFTGIKIKKTLNYSFTILPESDEENEPIPVFVFSERSGIKDVGSAGGEKIYLEIDKLSDVQQLSTLAANRSPADKSNQGFFYRLPVAAKISIEVSSDIKVEKVYQIAQFGTVTFLPGSVSTVQFHPETGGVKNILIE